MISVSIRDNRKNDLILNTPLSSKNAIFYISTIISPHPSFRVRVAKFRTKMGLMDFHRLANFQLPRSKIGGGMGLKIFFPTPSLKIDIYDFRNFLPVSQKLQWAKTLKV